MEVKMDEKWEVCEDFQEFSVSTLGRVRDLEKDKFVPSRLNRQGLLMVTLRDDWTQKTRMVALLVAKAFIPPHPIEYFTSVIHLNGDRSDCRAMNLMWRSRPYALQYHAMFNDEPFRESVYIPQKDEFYYSLREACVKYGLIERVAHQQMCNGERIFPYNWDLERSTE